MMWGPGWNNWWAGLLMMAMFWGVLVAIVFLLRSLSSRADRDGNARPSQARAILEERFARGEISEEEFEKRRQVLDRSTRSVAGSCR